MNLTKSLKVSKVEARKRVRSRVHFVSDISGTDSPVLLTLTLSPKNTLLLRKLQRGSRWDVVLREVAPDAPLFRRVKS